MTRARLLREADAGELAHWRALYLLEAREGKERQKEQALKTRATALAGGAKRRLKNGGSRNGGH